MYYFSCLHISTLLYLLLSTIFHHFTLPFCTLLCSTLTPFFHSKFLYYILLLDNSTRLSSALLSVTSFYPITSYLTLLFSVHLGSTPFLPSPPPSGPPTPIQLTILPSIPLCSSIFPPFTPLHSCPLLSLKNSTVKKIYLCLSCLQPGV